MDVIDRGIKEGHIWPVAIYDLYHFSRGYRLISGGQAILSRLRGPPGQRLHWFDQRGLRCRSAIHAARLRGAGVECGGGSALLGEYGIILQKGVLNEEPIYLYVMDISTNLPGKAPGWRPLGSRILRFLDTTGKRRIAPWGSDKGHIWPLAKYDPLLFFCQRQQFICIFFFMHKNHDDISHHEAKRNPGTKIEYLRVLDRK